MKKINFNDYIPEKLADNQSCRLITTEQYQEYLKLKEEHKPLSWEELKEEAKKMGYHYGSGFIVNDNITLETKRGKYVFIPNGTIYFYPIHRAKECTLAIGRTPDQMLAIMKALQQEVDDER